MSDLEQNTLIYYGICYDRISTNPIVYNCDQVDRINFGAEPDKLNPSKTPTIYSVYPVMHSKWQRKFK